MKFGVNIVTKYWEENSDFKAELEVYGHTVEEAMTKFHRLLEVEKSIEVPCEYYLCSEAVVKKLKPFEVSKPFKSGYRQEKPVNYYVAFLNCKEVSDYYNSLDEIGQFKVWCQECSPCTMDISKLSMRAAKKDGLFVEIENKLNLTNTNNRAMIINGLANKFACTPVKLINKYLT